MGEQGWRDDSSKKKKKPTNIKIVASDYVGNSRMCSVYLKHIVTDQGKGFRISTTFLGKHSYGKIYLCRDYSDCYNEALTYAKYILSCQ